MEAKFYICNHCGNIVAYVENKSRIVAMSFCEPRS